MSNYFDNDKPSYPNNDSTMEELIHTLNQANAYVEEVKNKIILLCNSIDSKIN